LDNPADIDSRYSVITKSTNFGADEDGNHNKYRLNREIIENKIDQNSIVG